MNRVSKTMRYAGIAVAVILCFALMMKVKSMLAHEPEAAYLLIIIAPIVAWDCGRLSLKRITRDVAILEPMPDFLNNSTLKRSKELLGNLSQEDARRLHNRLGSGIGRFGWFWCALGLFYLLAYGLYSVPYSGDELSKPDSVFEMLDIRHFGYVDHSVIDGYEIRSFSYYDTVHEYSSYLLRLLPVIFGIVAASRIYRTFNSWRMFLDEKAHPERYRNLFDLPAL